MFEMRLAEANLKGGDRGMLPLSMAKAGETVTIRKITGKDEVRQHLAELGLVVDTDVTVVNEIAGNLILQVKSCLLYTSPSPRDGLLSRMPSSA